MRIGFTSIYSWRPHVEQLVYLANLVKSAGHEVRFLTCDADMPTCYTRELRPQRNHHLECVLCRIGGIRSYKNRDVVSFRDMNATQNSVADLLSRDLGASSASSIMRLETDQDYSDDGFVEIRNKLNIAAAIGYDAARTWIEREELNAVIAFNGRIDATNGIMHATKDAGKRYISMERTWFGDGLQLLPEENCLGLKSIHPMVEKWADVPLTDIQARKAAAIVAARFLRTGKKEWRTYNTSATSRNWPGKGARRILLLPGSRSEIWGVPDYKEEWPTRTAAYDALITHLDLEPADLVLRAHPNWGEKIGRETGQRSERYYQAWAKHRGITLIPSADNTSTQELIEQAEVIVVASSTAALEAALIGKRVVALTPSPYSRAGFEERAYNPNELTKILPHSSLLPPREIARKTLRFCYSFAYRISQYVDFVRCVTSTDYKYSEGADPRRILDIIHTGQLTADDGHFAENSLQEDAVLDLIESRKWNAFMSDGDSNSTNQLPAFDIERRTIFRSVDVIRSFFPHGDR